MPVARLTLAACLLALSACSDAPTRAELAEDGRNLLASLGEVVDTLTESHTADSVRAGVDDLVSHLDALKDRAVASSRAVADDPDVKAAVARARLALQAVEDRLKGVVEDQELREALDRAAERLRAQLDGSAASEG